MRIPFGKSISLSVLMLIIFSQLYAARILVYTEDPVYCFLQRMDTRGLLPSYQGQSLPMERGEIAAYLQTLSAVQTRLNPIERQLLQEHLADYRMEISQSFPTEPVVEPHWFAPFKTPHWGNAIFQNLLDRSSGQEETHLLRYEETTAFAWFDIELGIREDWKGSIARYLLADVYHFRGEIGNQLSAQLKIHRFVKQYRANFSEPATMELGNWSMLQADSTISYDQTYASLAFHNSYFSIGLYRNPVLWGTSFYNNLILSDHGAPFPYLGFQTHWKNLRFSYLHASLLNDSTAVKTTAVPVRNRSKYLAGHRLDLTLWHGRIVLGFTDLIVYGDRNIEIAYLLPVNFFWSAEHSLYDRDNSLLAFDFKIRLLPNLQIYGTLLLDELRFSELGKQWWGNKQGLQAGLRWATALADRPVDLQLEFTAIRPWVYSHQTLTTNFTHNGIILGFPAGANSRMLFFNAETFLNWRTQLQFSYRFLQHGEDDVDQFWGGDPAIYYTQRDQSYDHETRWLMGKIRDTHQIQLLFHYAVSNNIWLITGAEYHQTRFAQQYDHFSYVYLGLRINL